MKRAVLDTLASEFRTVLPPVHRAGTVVFGSIEALEICDWRTGRSSSYGRDGSPTTRELELQLAALEGARHAMLVPSGLAAISLVSLTLLKAGDLVAIPANGYPTGAQMLDSVIRRFGVKVCVYDAMVPSSWRETIPAGTRLVWVEAPGSITMEVPDLGQLVGHARRIGAHSAIDNTYSAGIHLNPFTVGCEVSVQALSKYQSGGCDVVLGSVSCVDDGLHARLLEAKHLLGLSVGGDDAYLVLRGLPTLRLRYEACSRTAGELAGWFRGRPLVRRVLFPAFPESPGFENWKRYFSGAAGVFSVAISDEVPEARVRAFVNSMRVLQIGLSWGGHVSLVRFFGGAHPAVKRLRATGEPVGTIVRFSTGLDSAESVLHDVRQAWERCIAAG